MNLCTTSLTNTYHHFTFETAKYDLSLNSNSLFSPVEISSPLLRIVTYDLQGFKYNVNRHLLSSCILFFLLYFLLNNVFLFYFTLVNHLRLSDIVAFLGAKWLRKRC